MSKYFYEGKIDLHCSLFVNETMDEMQHKNIGGSSLQA